MRLDLKIKNNFFIVYISIHSKYFITAYPVKNSVPFPGVKSSKKCFCEKKKYLLCTQKLPTT